MSVRMRAAGGVVAIWDAALGLLPFLNPLSYLPYIRFHSALDYIRVIDTVAVSLNLPSRATSPFGNLTTHTQSYTLFAHGRPGIPLCFASTVIAGEDVAFTGSIAVQEGNGNACWARWLTIGADATNVYAFEYTPHNGSTFAAITLPITVWITDEDLS